MRRFSQVLGKGCILYTCTRNNILSHEIGCNSGSGRLRLPALLISARLLSKRTYSSAAGATQQQQQQLSPEDEACIALYFTGKEPATDILGPTVVKDIPGKGRGLVSSRPLAVGDLVMAVRPLAVLHGPQDCMPSPDDLADHIAANLPSMPPHHRTALAQMYGAKKQPNNSSNNTSSSPSTSPSAAAAADKEADVRGVVSYNAYGDEYEDLPAADLRSQHEQENAAAASPSSSSPSTSSGPRSLVGVWPHFSSLNHSCAPNCVHYVVGATMLVRAVQPIPEGAELLVSYLGRDDLAPRQVRQAVLQSRYGFHCDCVRCRTEEQLPEELQTLLQQLYDRSRHELAPRFERLAAAAATEAAAEAAGMPLAVEGDEEDGVEEEGEVEEAGEEGSGLKLGGGGAAAVAGSGMTAAEAAKKALRKSSPSAHWPAQLAALQPRLDECARQLHVALRELQEDDEAVEDPLEAPSSSPTSSPAAPALLSRVQAAQSAAYQLLELLHLHAELAAAAAGGGPWGGSTAAAAGALQACWHVLDAISRGSELQVFQACKLLSDALKQTRHRPASKAPGAPGPPPPEAVREAAALLGQSLTARYGRLRGQQLTRLTQSALRTSRGFF